ncbi:L-rhamnose isomerase [Christensenella tenuis]|nr:L-rhamnose isomerase [Christensenella tenuis]
MSERFKQLSAALEDKGMDVTAILQRLKEQVIELPSWAVGNSGTRYGTFREEGSARTIWDKIDDCAEIQRVLGITPVMASHVAWDVTEDGQYAPVRSYAEEKGLKIGTVHPDVFSRQEYIYGSICSPKPEVREFTQQHFLDCVRVAKEMGSKVIGMWVADGTNYPGQDNLRERKHRLYEGLKVLYDAMDEDMKLVIEYKPFEPFFYTTDIADWGMSMLMCQKLGNRAKVLVDLGHHLPGVNIEQIISTLLDENMLGGFHMNNRRYADDDLITGTVNPMDLFLIYKEIIDAEQGGVKTDITYMLDQSHNIEPSIEGIIYSVMNAQTAYARALVIDREALGKAQEEYDVVGANKIVMDAFNTDVQPLLEQARIELGLSDTDPLRNYRQGGYAQKIKQERGFDGINTLGG